MQVEVGAAYININRGSLLTNWRATDFSPPLSRGPPGVFGTYFYNHAHRPRLEKLLHLELSRSPSGYFKALLDPDGGFTSETAARRFQK